MNFFYKAPKVCFGRGAITYLKDLDACSRVAVITDPNVAVLGHANRIREILENRSEPCQVLIVDQIELDPSAEYFRKGADILSAFNPDVIIGLGGGSAINAAKGIWLLYEHPELDYNTLSEKMIAMKKDGRSAADFSKKAQFITIPATSGSVAETTCYTLVSDKRRGGAKYPMVDYDMTPDLVISDPDLANGMPGPMAAETGFNVLTSAIESNVSVFASDYTDTLSLHAIRLVTEYLPRSVQDPGDLTAREKIHTASTIASMAVSNSYTGLCHSITNVISAEYEMSQGMLNAVILPYVISYNAVDFEFPELKTDEKYGAITDALGMNYGTTAQKVSKLVTYLRDFASTLGLESRLRDCRRFQGDIFPAEDLAARLEEISMRVFEDPCTTATPKHPQLAHIMDILKQAL